MISFALFMNGIALLVCGLSAWVNHEAGNRGIVIIMNICIVINLISMFYNLSQL